jgi:Tfp pilus assembly protein PilF
MSRIEKIIELLNTDPKDSFLNHALAMEYIKIGNAEAAINLLDKLLEFDPGYVGSYYHLAKLYESVGDTSKAIATYENGLVVAQQAGDRHAFNELRSALDELIM